MTIDKSEFIMSKQLLKSGTSIGANIRESEFAESKADFIHKLAIAQKETNETIYWLEFLLPKMERTLINNLSLIINN